MNAEVFWHETSGPSNPRVPAQRRSTLLRQRDQPEL